jgi:hypothetical protein
VEQVVFYRFLSPITAWIKRGFFDAESVEVLVEGAVPSPEYASLYIIVIEFSLRL